MMWRLTTFWAQSFKVCHGSSNDGDFGLVAFTDDDDLTGEERVWADGDELVDGNTIWADNKLEVELAEWEIGSIVKS